MLDIIDLRFPAIIRRMIQDLAHDDGHADRMSGSSDDPADLRRLASRRFDTETFQVLAKGLSPSRLESWFAGSRSRLSREFGAATELTRDVCERSLTEVHQQRVNTVKQYAELLDETSCREAMRGLADGFLQGVCDDATFRLSVCARLAARGDVQLQETVDESRSAIIRTLAESLEAFAAGWHRDLSAQNAKVAAVAILNLLEGLGLETAAAPTEIRKAALAGVEAIFQALATNTMVPANNELDLATGGVRFSRSTAPVPLSRSVVSPSLPGGSGFGERA